MEAARQSPYSSPGLARHQDIVSDLYHLVIARFVGLSRSYQGRGVLCATATRPTGGDGGANALGVMVPLAAGSRSRYAAVVASRRERYKRPAEAAVDRRGVAPDRTARRREKSLSTPDRRRSGVFYRGHAQCARGDASCSGARANAQNTAPAALPPKISIIGLI